MRYECRRPNELVRGKAWAMTQTIPTILIVDDNSDDRFFLARTLQRVASGLSLQSAASGDEAVAYLEGSGIYADRLLFPYPSFVITDCEMPDGDGFSVLRYLHATAPPSRVRVMMLSSSENPEYPDRAHRLGASSYALKPGGCDALAPIISRFLAPLPSEGQDGVGRMRLA